MKKVCKAVWDWIKSHWKKVEVVVTIFSLLGISISWFFFTLPTYFRVNTLETNTEVIKSQLEDVQSQTQSLSAKEVLDQYFYFAEQHNFNMAWNLFSESRKNTLNGGYDGFVNWLNDLVSFEGLKVLEVPEKNSATTNVFIAKYSFNKKGFSHVPSIFYYYVKYNGESWQIDYSKPLLENDWKDNACDFYASLNSLTTPTEQVALDDKCNT